MISIKNLKVSYGNIHKEVTAIENINLEIGKGEICAIIGPSGGGKSTLLKVLAGIITDYRGEILIDGKKVDPKIHRIGFIPQNFGLVNWKNVKENILLSSMIKDGKRNIDVEFYEDIIKKLKLHGYEKRFPHQLSGGQRQRVSIGRAFLLKPGMLLMDESFSALDALTREEVQQLFLEVWHEHRVTTIFITHDIHEAIYLGKKIVVLSPSPGKVVQVIENPLFGKKQLDYNSECEALNRHLRNILKGVKEQ